MVPGKFPKGISLLVILILCFMFAGSSCSGGGSRSAPIPTLASVSPSSVTVGSADIAITATGANFTNDSIIKWNNSPLATTYVSSSSLTAVVPAPWFTHAGYATVTVTTSTNSSGGVSLTIVNPSPTLLSVNPSTLASGTSATTITLAGSNFIPASQVTWNGNTLTTNYLNSTSMQATVPATALTTAGTAQVAVVNPSPGGGTTSALTITVGNPVPTLTSLNPSTMTSGSAGTIIAVSGTNFMATSVVAWNGTALNTSYVSPTSLAAMVPPGALANPGSAEVTVTNPSPGGGTSAGLTFTIGNSVPTLASVEPNAIASGSSATTIGVSGTNFNSTSVVAWNGNPLNTTYISSTLLRATVPSGELTTAGTAQITITNSSLGGGTSNQLPVEIFDPAPHVSVLANSLAWDPANNVIYLSLPSTSGTNGNSIQVLDPSSITLKNAVFVGSEPNLLSISPTSKYLYVGLDGGNKVQRMTLPDLGTDIEINLGSDPTDGPYYPMDVQAAPNSDNTVAVVRGISNLSPEEEGGVLIYDDSVPRPNVLCGWINIGCTPHLSHLYDSIQWNTDGTEIFAANNETTSLEFSVVTVDGNGLGTPTVYSDRIDGFREKIHYDATTGYVYGDFGGIFNPADGSIVGKFAGTGLMVPDGGFGVAFFLGQTSAQLGTSNYTLQSFDMSRFTPIASTVLRGIQGAPTKLIRWGTNGLAFTTKAPFTTTPTGAVYVVTFDNAFIGK